MKKIFFVLSVILTLSTLSFCQSGQSGSNNVEITFKETAHNFGTLKQGTDCFFEFEFKNTGKGDIILQNVTTSCGCTTPEWPKEPIKEGKTAKIKVKYDSNRIGPFNKTINIFSNAKNSPNVLTIAGIVETKQ